MSHAIDTVAGRDETGDVRAAADAGSALAVGAERDTPARRLTTISVTAKTSSSSRPGTSGIHRYAFIRLIMRWARASAPNSPASRPGPPDLSAHRRRCSDRSRARHGIAVVVVDVRLDPHRQRELPVKARRAPHRRAYPDPGCAIEDAVLAIGEPWLGHDVDRIGQRLGGVIAIPRPQQRRLMQSPPPVSSSARRQTSSARRPRSETIPTGLPAAFRNGAANPV